MSAINLGPRTWMKRPDAMPIIKRTRSWRGVMQVRYDDAKADRNTLIAQAAIWSPLRVFGLMFVTTCVSYVYLGHDQFMHSVMGYESEMAYEAKVNPSPDPSTGNMIEKTRLWRKPIRNMEEPLHPTRHFDVYKDGAKP